MSIKILNTLLGDIDPFLNPEKYYAQQEYWSCKPTYEYIDYRLAHKPEVDTYWEERMGRIQPSFQFNFNGNVLENGKPGVLALLEKDSKIEVKDLVFNSFSSKVNFNQYVPHIHSIDDLLIVMDSGLWDAIDLIRLEFADGQQIALISNRKVGLDGKFIVDLSSWEVVITPRNEKLKELFEMGGEENFPF